MNFIAKIFILSFITAYTFAQKNKIDSLHSLLKTSTNDTAKINQTNQLAWLYFKKNDFKTAKNLVFNNLNAARKHNFAHGLAISYETLGEIYYQISQKDSSIYYTITSANLYEKLGNFKAASNENQKLGYIFLNVSKFPESMNAFQKSLDFAKKSKNNELETQTLVGFGWLYHQMGNYLESNAYYSKAQKLAEKQNNHDELLNIKFGFANNFIATSEYAKAQKIYFELANIYKNNKKLSQYANTLSIGANLYRRLNQVPKAEKPLLEVYKIQTQIDDKYNLISTSRYLGMLYTDLNKLDIAEKYLIESLKLAQEFNDDGDKVKVYYTLERLYFIKKDLKNGDKFQKLVIRMRDSLYTAENNKALAEFDVKYKTAEKEKQLTESKLETAQTRNWTIGLGIAFLSFVGFGLLFWKIQKEKQRTALQTIEIENTRKILHAREIERQRIAKELHDSVGSQLTVVSTSLDNAFFLAENHKLIPQKLESINFDVREAAQSLRDTIWATHNTTISLSNIYSRIHHYLAKVLGENDKIEYTSSFTGTDLELYSIEALNFFRIFQEAIQNIQKHSAATKVSFSLINQENSLNLIINDNGKGFETNTQNPYENFGLSNMKHRSDEINATLNIQSVIGKGTTIEVKMQKP